MIFLGSSDDYAFDVSFSFFKAKWWVILHSISKIIIEHKFSAKSPINKAEIHKNNKKKKKM